MQRGIVDIAKPIIEEEIPKKLDIHQLCANGLMNSFCSADFGCSTGHNSFLAMQMITRSLQQKFQSERLVSQTPEFYAFFNDQVKNDFNTLFRSLPPERQYRAVGLPGSFYGRLLPKASLHFAYSSAALQWLSQAPKVVFDPSSAAWNKGRVHYSGARQEVVDAYSSQHAEDIETFLEARAQELVTGGLMALVLPGAIPTSAENSNTSYTNVPKEMALIEIGRREPTGAGGGRGADGGRGYGEEEMGGGPKPTGLGAEEPAGEWWEWGVGRGAGVGGRLREEEIDSFNFPLYFPFPEELKAVRENGSYNIERMEILDNPGRYTLNSAEARALFYRATFEKVLINHFGCEIIDEVFDRYTQKLEASPAVLSPDNDKTILIFVLLKRI
ncbi:UNVERIFIED_CONTAM: Loganic acid O-methyltransferase [Sesamum latifolium]|uniref:Loganic acid O-methyltransferase n=1 Tax=Sesamum latifolium TaxID=2727402 RepID=A0AAW2Y9H4_9LAMI